MWGVAEIGKKQYLVKEGDVLLVQRLKNQKGSILLDKVLLLAEDGDVTLGTPYINKVKIKAHILGEEKGKKTIIYKYKRRKKYRKKQGHRQTYTRLKIEEIVTSSPKGATKKK